MSLKGMEIPKSKVLIPGGGSFSVRGLSFVDLRVLFVKYGPEMSEFFDKLVNAEGGVNLSAEDAARLSTLFIGNAPALAAEAIAIAADSPEAFENVLQLPFPTQVEALQEIGKMTFGTEGGLKKFLETARTLLGVIRESPKVD